MIFDLFYKTFMMIAAIAIIGLLIILIFGYPDDPDDNE